MHGLQGKIHELEDVFRRMNDELEMYRREGNITLDESEELKEAYSKLSQDKDVYKRRVLSPKLSIDMLSSGRNKQLKDENDLLKEVYWGCVWIIKPIRAWRRRNKSP